MCQVKTITILILYLLAYWIVVVVVSVVVNVDDGDGSNDGDDDYINTHTHTSSYYKKRGKYMFTTGLYTIPSPSTIPHSSRYIYSAKVARLDIALDILLVYSPKRRRLPFVRTFTTNIFFVGLNTELTAMRAHIHKRDENNPHIWTVAALTHSLSGTMRDGSFNRSSI